MGANLELVVLLPFALTLFVPALARRLRFHVGWAVLCVPAVIAIYLTTLLPRTGRGEVLATSWTWAPGYGMEFSLALDAFSMLFALLIAGIGSLVVLYSIFYLDRDEDLSRFYICILLFMGAMLGVVLSDNLLVLYMFWEITSISSFLLIGFWHTEAASRDGALKSLLTTVMGGLALLAGFLLLGTAAGTYSLRELTTRAAEVVAHPSYPAIALLVLLGAFTKSAQAPFHLWLPGAMAAPTPVSAYLHSATMVKAGIYLVARMSPVLGSTSLWFYTVAGVGMATMVLGSYLAVQQRDLKALLAFSTVSQLGLIVTMFAFGTEEAAAAGVLHILNHGIFKGALFMLVGIIDHETGTRDITHLSGLRRKMPVTAALTWIAALSMAGIPLFNGFVSKEMILEALFHPPTGSNAFTYALPVLAVLGSSFTVMYCLVLAHRLFFGPAPEAPHEPHEASWGLLLPPALLAALAVVLGIFPGLVGPGLVAPGVAAVAGTAGSVHVAAWHGLTPALYLSVAALAVGTLLYWRHGPVVSLLRRISAVPVNMNVIYGKLLEGIEGGAKRLTGRIMTGFLRDYVVYVTGCAAALIGFALVRFGRGGLGVTLGALTPISWSELTAILALIAGSVTAVVARKRISIALGVATVGFMVAMLWFLWEAPDLALTQTIVETVSIVPLFLAFGFLPSLRERSVTARARRVNVAVAAALGTVAALFTLASGGHRLFGSISHYFVENSLTLGGGRNIVNVMLVDFRGFDTLFETTVLALVATAVYTLVRSRQDRGGARRPESPFMINPVIVPAVSRVLFYLVLVFSLYLFFRGHHHPGGGFAAGVMTASAVIIWALAFERTAAVRLVPVHPRHIVASGLLVMIGEGLAGAALGHPFLSQTFGHFHLPWVGDVELASALVFDLGVWLVVFGAIHWLVVSMSDGIPLEQEHVKVYRAYGIRHGKRVARNDGTADRN